MGLSKYCIQLTKYKNKIKKNIIIVKLNTDTYCTIII